MSDGDVRRPRPLHSSKSFTRLEPTTQSPLGRSRASTIQGTISELPHADHITLSPGSEEKAAQRDIFVSKDEDDSDAETVEDNAGSASKQLEAFEELPIEIRSLTERYVLWRASVASLWDQHPNISTDFSSLCLPKCIPLRCL